jgi:hypothetical protein
VARATQRGTPHARATGVRLEQLALDVDERVAALDRALATGDVAVDVQDGELHVRRLPSAERPAATTALAAHVAGRLPQSTSPTS